jgi:uridine kinase
VFVAIDGRGGSGKTTLAGQLAARLPGVTVVHTDDFARGHVGGRLPVSGWEHKRFYEQVAAPLLDDRPGRYQRYDWDAQPLDDRIDVPCEGILVVEGVSSTRVELLVPWDATIWVETPTDERLARGIARDGEHMRDQWEQVWEVEEDAYVRSQHPAARADVVVSGSANA